MMHRLYDIALAAASPALRPYLARRAARGFEDRKRLPERRGIPGRSRPAGRLVWFHGASIGETTSVLSLIARIGRDHPNATVLVTSGTVTSAELLARHLPEEVIHQFLPVDHRPWVERFLDHWRPDLALWVESELWPNMLHALRRRRTPVVLLNARMSARSHRNWRLMPSLAGGMIGSFRLILAQDEVHARRFGKLGGSPIRVLGNLKFAADPLGADEEALEDMLDAVADRPVWLAASTHPGEEAIVADAHDALRRAHAGVLTLLIPRHPQRGDEIEALLADRKSLRVARRSRGEMPGAATEVYLIDTLGELGLFYRVAEAALIGGSLVPHGGQNPLEPARLGAAIVHGPQMFNFTDIVVELHRAGGAREIRDGRELVPAISGLLADPAARNAQVERARAVAMSHGDVMRKVLHALEPFLERL